MAIIPYHENFYVLPEDVDGEFLILRGEEYHHAVKVVRKTVGSRFAAVDGCGNFYECEVSSITNQTLQARILTTRQQVGEPKTNLILAQSVLKGNRFDWLVEKGTEIGVSAFFPLLCERSIAIRENKAERWRRIALAAMKQCGRSVWPSVSEPIPFSEALRLAETGDLRWIAHEDAMTGLSQIKDMNKKCDNHGGRRRGVLLVGPEGGFTEKEIDDALSQGFTAICLGPRRLRSETAGIVAATLLLKVSGDLGGADN